MRLRLHPGASERVEEGFEVAAVRSSPPAKKPPQLIFSNFSVPRPSDLHSRTHGDRISKPEGGCVFNVSKTQDEWCGFSTHPSGTFVAAATSRSRPIPAARAPPTFYLFFPGESFAACGLRAPSSVCAQLWLGSRFVAPPMLRPSSVKPFGLRAAAGLFFYRAIRRRPRPTVPGARRLPRVRAGFTRARYLGTRPVLRASAASQGAW